MQDASRRRGFTLIEALVVVMIIGVLVGLLLPAVQAAREAARRTRCANNVKQIGQAIHLHVEARNTFPGGSGSPPANPSYLVQLLPYLENVPLYNAINMEGTLFISTPNRTAQKQVPGIFLCPSDGGRRPDMEYAINYAGNVGRSRDNQDDGVFARDQVQTTQDISDGLSQTVGVAEWLVGVGFAADFIEGQGRDLSRIDGKRYIYALRRVFLDNPSDFAAFVRVCGRLDRDDINPQGIINHAKGDTWLWGGLMSGTLYNHLMPPNQPSCSARESLDATTATSLHRGGINVLTMDGAVHFVKDSIAHRVWYAAGTRSGGETSRFPE